MKSHHTKVGAVTEMIAPDPAVDASRALAQIGLRDLARKLAGGMRCPVVDSAGAISGEVDLF